MHKSLRGYSEDKVQSSNDIPTRYLYNALSAFKPYVHCLHASPVYAMTWDVAFLATTISSRQSALACEYEIDRNEFELVACDTER